MIAGEAGSAVGILLAVFAIIPLQARKAVFMHFINLSALDNGLGAFLVSPAARLYHFIVFGLPEAYHV